MSKLIDTATNVIKTIVRVVLYLRLSDEDRDKLTKEELSESIKNQEMMLRDYAEQQGWEIVGVYNDEDYSGSDRDRPNFNIMIGECEKGNVDVVLVKTQARFARDVELVEKYVHDKFLQWNVRFVTYIERIDNTKRETKKTSQITAMTDEWMLEDTSYNIRETFKKKREKGQFTGSFAPYGYMRDPENKNHLVPDPVVADVVARIFDEYVKGYGLEKIAKGLTSDNILSPLEYKMMNGSKLKLPIIKEYVDYKTISKTGTFVIKMSYLNNERQILKDLTTIELITSDNINFSNKFNLRLYKVKNDKIKIYYSTKSYDELNISIKNNKPIYQNIDFSNNDDWVLLNINDEIPNNATCIGTYLEQLDRTNEIFYEFEATLKENKSRTHYFYKVYPTCNNIDVDLDYQIQIRNKHQWNEQTIKKFLKDEVYIGNLVQFKTTTVSYKNHTVIYNEKKKQIRVVGTHEPLIDKAVWYDAQERLEQRKKSCKSGEAHLLANKVCCDECKSTFCKCGKNDENGMAYLCCKDKATKWSNCDNKKYIKETELQDFVLARINDLLTRFYKEEVQIEINDNMVEKELFKNKINNLNKERLSIDKELKSKDSYFQSLYEDRKKGFLDDDEYMKLKNKYKEDYSKLEDRLETIQKELIAIEVKQEKLKDKKTLFNKYKHVDKLSVEVVNDFVDKIFIGHYNEENKQRSIHIDWNFTI